MYQEAKSLVCKRSINVCYNVNVIFWQTYWSYRTFIGGDISFSTYEELETAFAKEEIHPGDLKSAAEIYINRLLDPIRKEFDGNSKLKSLASKAYPLPQKQSKWFIPSETDSIDFKYVSIS